MIKIKTINSNLFGKITIALRVDKEVVVKLTDVCKALEINTNTARERLGETNIEIINTAEKTTHIFAKVKDIKERCLSLSTKNNAAQILDKILRETQVNGLTTLDISLDDLGNIEKQERIYKMLQYKELEIANLKAEKEDFRYKAEIAESIYGRDIPVNFKMLFDNIRIKGITLNSMYEILRSAGVLNDNNTPNQKLVDDGSFRVVKTIINRHDSQTTVEKIFIYKKGVKLVEETLRKMVGVKQ